MKHIVFFISKIQSHNILHQMFQPQPALSSNAKPLPISKDLPEPPNIGPGKSNESAQPAKIIPLEEPEQEGRFFIY